MKRNGKLYRNIFILILFLLVIFALASRYFPFSKILRVRGGREIALNEALKTGSEPPNSIAFNFEIGPGKEVPNGIVMGNAHSGKYAAKAYGKNSFTPALEKPAGELGIDRLRYVSVSAWVFVKPSGEPVNAALVLAASNNVGVNICWKGIGLKDPGVPRGQWFKMSGQFDLGEVKFTADTRLQMYFWNNSSNDILIDDYYLVYGGPAPRHGDTTYVDLTKGPFQAKFNYPPFPVKCMRMAVIGGPRGGSLIAGGETQQGMILPKDPMISGVFLTGNAGKDVLFVIPSSGKPSVYSYCNESNSFSRSGVELPLALPAPAAGKQYLLRGKFISGETEQLLYMSEKSCSLFKFSGKGGACSGGNSLGAEVLWQSEKFENLVFDSEKPLLAADFDGDGITELLSLNGNGDWKLYRFQAGKPAAPWALVAESKETTEDWKLLGNQVNLTAGHFIPGRAQAEVLTVRGNSRERKCSYTLRMYNPSLKRFVACFPGKYGPGGKITGIDSLKPADRFFCGNFGPNGTPMVMRYNRDWRYDLKEISFSDSTYQVLNNIDFEGYPADHNPKYYEVLKLVPGRYTGSQCSFIVIGRNCRNKEQGGEDCSEYEELPGLPGFISLYSFVGR